MKKNKLFSFIAAAFMLTAACTPDTFELGSVDVAPTDLVEGVAFTITHDDANPNIIYLESKMQGYSPIWLHPQGRSQAQKVTLKMPFEGTFEVTFGVQTRGGIVFAEPATFEITEFYGDFLSDPMWTHLTGGIDSSKTWYLDLDAEGVSRYFIGGQYFAGLDDTWDNWGEGDEFEELGEGFDSWLWEADWADWIMPKADFGTMTFSLKGAATVTVNHLTIPARGEQTGTFLIDEDNHLLRMTGTTILHPSNKETAVQDWQNIKILSLTEHTMQLGVVRISEPCLLVYNFISKEYKDSWVPEDQPDPEPNLPNGWENDVNQAVSTTIKWVLSEQNPLDWCTLAGSRMNGWNAPDEYPGWLGTPDPAIYGDFSMTLNSVDNTAEFVKPDGTTVSCGYTLDSKGIYTFSEPVPSFTLISWASFHGDAGTNQLRIMSIEKSGGKVTGMWVGAKEYDGGRHHQYIAYHLIPQAGGGGGGGGEESPLLAVNNAKVIFKKENADARIEIYNEYGNTKNDPPINTAEVVFANRLAVTFTLSGVTLNGGAAGTYPTGLQFADGGWGLQYWGDGTGAGDTQVTGNGTYIVYVNGAVDAGTGVNVFCIDMKGMWADIDTPSNIAVKIECIHLY